MQLVTAGGNCTEFESMMAMPVAILLLLILKQSKNGQSESTVPLTRVQTNHVGMLRIPILFQSCVSYKKTTN